MCYRVDTVIPSRKTKMTINVMDKQYSCTKLALNSVTTKHVTVDQRPQANKDGQRVFNCECIVQLLQSESLLSCGAWYMYSAKQSF